MAENNGENTMEFKGKLLLFDPFTKKFLIDSNHLANTMKIEFGGDTVLYIDKEFYLTKNGRLQIGSKDRILSYIKERLNTSYNNEMYSYDIIRILEQGEVLVTSSTDTKRYNFVFITLTRYIIKQSDLDTSYEIYRNTVAPPNSLLLPKTSYKFATLEALDIYMNQLLNKYKDDIIELILEEYL